MLLADLQVVIMDTTMCVHTQFIIESVDSISRDGPDMAIIITHYKNPNISEAVEFQPF